MQRYNLRTDYLVGMATDNNGAWVRYKVAAARIAELQAELNRIREMDDKALKHWNEKIHKLEAQLAKYVQAVGLLSTALPERLVDVDDPEGLVRDVMAQLAAERERNEGITCPFCGETGFDKIGLKIHLVSAFCEEYNTTPDWD